MKFFMPALFIFYIVLIVNSFSMAWEYKIKENPLTDEVSALAYTVSTNQSNNKAAFVINCNSNKDISVYIKFIAKIASTSKGNTEYVLQRINKEEPKYVEWYIDKKNNILYPINNDELLNKLYNANTFTVGTDSPIEEDTIASFDISNIKTAMNTVKDKCHK